MVYLQYAEVSMMKFKTRVKNMTEKQMFVLSEQTRKIKQTTPIKTRKNPGRGTNVSHSIHRKEYHA